MQISKWVDMGQQVEIEIPSLLTLALEQREKLKHAVTCMDRWCQRCNKLQEEL